jgi:hypothetical protein
VIKFSSIADVNVIFTEENGSDALSEDSDTPLIFRTRRQRILRETQEKDHSDRSKNHK